MRGLLKSRGGDVFAVSKTDNTYPVNSFKNLDVPGYTIKVLDGDVLRGALKATETRFKRAAVTIRQHGKYAE